MKRVIGVIIAGVLVGCGATEYQYEQLQELYRRKEIEARQAQTVATQTAGDLAERQARVRELERELQQAEAKKIELERTLRILSLFGIDVTKLDAARFPKKLSQEGQVIDVEDRGNMFIFALGSKQGVKKGDTLVVHRFGKFLGKARVVSTEETTAKAISLGNFRVPDTEIAIGCTVFVTTEE